MNWNCQSRRVQWLLLFRRSPLHQATLYIGIGSVVLISPQKLLTGQIESNYAHVAEMST